MDPTVLAIIKCFRRYAASALSVIEYKPYMRYQTTSRNEIIIHTVLGVFFGIPYFYILSPGLYIPF
jgi:hypothetical protein